MSSAGIVKSFNDGKGWGFIECDEVDGDVFLHVNDCQEGRPNAGDQVTFDLEDDPKRDGQVKAINVTGCTGEAGGGGGKGKGGGGGGRRKDPRKGVRGQVKSYNDSKGWGFLDMLGDDVFLHKKDCQDGVPRVGDWLTFDVEDDPKRGEGQLKAINVRGCGASDGGGKGRKARAAASESKGGGYDGVGCGYGAMPMGPPMGPPMGYGPMGYGAMGYGPMMPKGMGGYGSPYDPCYGSYMKGGYGGPYGGCPGACGGAYDPYGGAMGYGPLQAKGQAKGSGRKEGIVKSWNDGKGWGFIEFNGSDVFLHHKDCLDGRPNAGDWVSFDGEPDPARGGQLKAPM